METSWFRGRLYRIPYLVLKDSYSWSQNTGENLATGRLFQAKVQELAVDHIHGNIGYAMTQSMTNEKETTEGPAGTRLSPVGESA